MHATTNDQPLTERRQYPRFQISDLTAYAVAKRGWPRFPVIGDIVDICTGGLSFCYAATERWTYRLSGLDILLTDGSFHLDKLRLRPIWDFEMPGEESEICVGVAARRCGVKFLDLTDDQKSDLRCFIQFHTAADPES